MCCAKNLILRNTAGCERDADRLYESGYKKRTKKKEQYLLDVQSSTDKKLVTTQDPQTLQNVGEKQYCQYCIYILCLVISN